MLSICSRERLELLPRRLNATEPTVVAAETVMRARGYFFAPQMLPDFYFRQENGPLALITSIGSIELRAVFLPYKYYLIFILSRKKVNKSYLIKN